MKEAEQKESKTTTKKVRKSTSEKKESSSVKTSASKKKTEKTKEKKVVSEKKTSTPKRKKTVKPMVAQKVEQPAPLKDAVILEEDKKEVVKPITKNEKIEGKKNENNFHTSEVVILVVITCIISIIMGTLITYSLLKGKEEKPQEVSSDLQELIDQYQFIKQNYKDEVTERELVTGAINGMLEAAGDPYAEVIDKSSRLWQELEGSFYGVGIEVYNDENGNIIVYHVFENGPAERAGLQAGDIINSIDGIDLTGESTSVLSTYIKDSTKSEFVIEYTREGEKTTVTVKKENVIIPSVYSDLFEQNGKKVGYLQVTIFSATTYNQFKNALEELENENIDRLIIDVRNNSGGRLDAVLDMVSLFLDSSHIICEEEADGQIEKHYSTGQVTKSYPIAILVNGASASASEVLTSALKEEYGAIVVGTTTFGKGTSQQVKTLQNGEQYKLTTKKWLTSKGEWINGVGIEPTYYVELSNSFYENPSVETDNQLQSALSLLAK